MSLGLHPDCLSRLKHKIAEQLGNIDVQNKMFLERKSSARFFDAEDVLPKTGRIREKLEQYISETPLFDFLWEFLSQELTENQKYDSDVKICKLKDLAEYSDLASTSRRLISEFESLPWKYCLSIMLHEELSNVLEHGKKEYALSDRIRLALADDAFFREFPLQSGTDKRDIPISVLSRLSTFGPPELYKDAAYLQFSAEGFIGKYVTTNPIHQSICSLKAFCGIAIALRLFKIKYSYHPVPLWLGLIVHRQIQGTWIIQGTHHLEGELARTFANLEIHDLDGVLDTAEKKRVWIEKCLGKMSKIFRNQDQAERIVLAGQWFFDSYCGRNELLSFVQITVALEILLGDKAVSDLMGLGELLRNRCAYLIAKSHEEREKILKDFKEIYEIRSRIVHRGKSKLTLHETGLFVKLQWICRRVIQEEVELMTTVGQEPRFPSTIHLSGAQGT